MGIFGVYSLDTILAIVFAFLYYKAAEIDNSSGTIWAGLSVIVSLAIRLTGLGLLGLILGQAALFFALTIIRVLFSRKG